MKGWLWLTAVFAKCLIRSAISLHQADGVKQTLEPIGKPNLSTIGCQPELKKGCAPLRGASQRLFPVSKLPERVNFLTRAFHSTIFFRS